MNSLSDNPNLRRRKKLEDKNKYSIEREPKLKKAPRRKLRTSDIDGRDPEELEELGYDN